MGAALTGWALAWRSPREAIGVVVLLAGLAGLAGVSAAAASVTRRRLRLARTRHTPGGADKQSRRVSRGDATGRWLTVAAAGVTLVGAHLLLPPTAWGWAARAAFGGLAALMAAGVVHDRARRRGDGHD